MDIGWFKYLANDYIEKLDILTNENNKDLSYNNVIQRRRYLYDIW